jgi:hypothetical protein
LEIFISPDVIDQEVFLGETILMNVKTLNYFALDSLGSAFWKAMQTTSDADEVLQQVVLEGDVPAAQLEVKLRNILNGLSQSRLIELKPR